MEFFGKRPVDRFPTEEAWEAHKAKIRRLFKEHPVDPYDGPDWIEDSYTVYEHFRRLTEKHKKGVK
jgi:hypothetical protein